MATTLALDEPKNISLTTALEQVTVPRNARYIRIEALAHDIRLAMTGTDGGAIGTDFETFPQKAVYSRSLPGAQGKARAASDAVLYFATSSGSGSVVLTATHEGA